MSVKKIRILYAGAYDNYRVGDIIEVDDDGNLILGTTDVRKGRYITDVINAEKFVKAGFAEFVEENDTK